MFELVWLFREWTAPQIQQPSKGNFNENGRYCFEPLTFFQTQGDFGESGVKIKQILISWHRIDVDCEEHFIFSASNTCLIWYWGLPGYAFWYASSILTPIKAWRENKMWDSQFLQNTFFYFNPTRVPVTFRSTF